jgi:hypothetical protein
MDKARVKWVRCEFGELEGIVTTLYKFFDWENFNYHVNNFIYIPFLKNLLKLFPYIYDIF